jgi:hypothetical protein
LKVLISRFILLPFQKNKKIYGLFVTVHPIPKMYDDVGTGSLFGDKKSIWE